MLVEHHAVEAELFGHHLLVEIFVEQLAALDRVEMLFGIPEETVLDDLVVRERIDRDAR